MWLINLFLYLFSFVTIWFGAGLIISSIEKISKRLHFSSFAVSFFLLGILTSIPEATVGINSIIENDPEIYVGNLIGGILVIFLFVIPVLAIFGNGIKLAHELDSKKILLSLAVIIAPSFLISDMKITIYEGLLMLLLYGALSYFIEKKKGLFEHIEDGIEHFQPYYLRDFIWTITGVVIVFLSGYIIVEQTIYFADILHVSSFIISITLLSFGTNLPELSIALRSIHSGKKDIAFGDYMGSAAANTLLFGLFTVVNKEDVIIPNHFFRKFIFIVLGLGLFYLFSRSKKDISRKEGLVLLLIYILFLFVEVL